MEQRSTSCEYVAGGPEAVIWAVIAGESLEWRIGDGSRRSERVWSMVADSVSEDRAGTVALMAGLVWEQSSTL